MDIRKIEPPREFEVGFPEHRVSLKDCARIELSADEQVTFTTPNGGEYDVVRKSWGFYATPSMNGRLVRFGFRSVLVRNRAGQLFLLLVEKGQENQFEEYKTREQLSIVCWFDEADALKHLHRGDR
jgi:hypothetical protein